MKRRNDNHSPGPVIRELVPSSHQRSELSDDSESQQDDNSTNEEDELPQSQSEFDPWNKLLQQAYYSLQDTFDETCETYLEQNPGMESAEAERKTFDELK